MPINKILAIASTVIAAVPRAGTFSPARREALSCELKLQPPTYDTRRFDDGTEVHAFALRIQKAVNLTGRRLVCIRRASAVLVILLAFISSAGPSTVLYPL